jgi:hypothetical protein
MQNDIAPRNAAPKKQIVPVIKPKMLPAPNNLKAPTRNMTAIQKITDAANAIPSIFSPLSMKGPTSSEVKNTLTYLLVNY